MGYFLLNPLRKFRDNPDKLLKPYLKPGMKVLDIGCAMGYYSLPAARMIRPGGRVYCIDLQEKMLQSLIKRAKKANLKDNVGTTICTRESLCLDSLDIKADFAIAVAVVHEVPNSFSFFDELKGALKDGAGVFFKEPKGHVSVESFRASLDKALKAGFTFESSEERISSREIVLIKEN
jgi:2-polyprenyl-3-methyl-5-hydroxy-6-metoxy-1,4-benzoquinol methylase